MSQVLIYDETKGWEAVQTTSGTVPSQRWHPTATLCELNEAADTALNDH